MVNGLRRIMLLLILLLFVPILAACSGGDSDTESNKSDRDNVANASDAEVDETLRGITAMLEPTADFDAPIPVPASENDIILTVSGKIDPTRANADGEIEMDLATLESLGTYSYHMDRDDEPFADTAMDYEGILVRDLLRYWGVPEDATTLTVTALDGYTIDLDIYRFHEAPVLLATKENGEYMQIDRHGPLMFMYPMSDYNYDGTKVKAWWIFQVFEIEVK